MQAKRAVVARRALPLHGRFEIPEHKFLYIKLGCRHFSLCNQSEPLAIGRSGMVIHSLHEPAYKQASPTPA